MNINAKTVANDEIRQRHGFTGADWWWDNEGILQIRVAAEIKDEREIACLILHEISEAMMCQHLGISQAAVDEFDSDYQAFHAVDINAGDEMDCPYRVPHNYATAIERILAGVLDVKWKTYDDKLSVI